MSIVFQREIKFLKNIENAFKEFFILTELGKFGRKMSRIRQIGKLPAQLEFRKISNV